MNKMIKYIFYNGFFYFVHNIIQNIDTQVQLKI